MNKLAYLTLMAAMAHPGALSELPIDLGKYKSQRPDDPKRSKSLKKRVLDKANKRRGRTLRK